MSFKPNLRVVPPCAPEADRLRECLECQPPKLRIVAALRNAAVLVEFAAFELASTGDQTHVAQLITNAAQIDKTAEKLTIPRLASDAST